MANGRSLLANKILFLKADTKTFSMEAKVHITKRNELTSKPRIFAGILEFFVLNEEVIPNLRMKCQAFVFCDSGRTCLGWYQFVCCCFFS